MIQIKTTVRSDDLTLLAQGIKRALLKRHSKLRLGMDSDGWLWIADDDAQEMVCLDLEGEVELFILED